MTWLTGVALAVGIPLVMGLIFIGPILTIWALNLIFGLAIPLTWKTYLAIMWLSMIVHGYRGVNRDPKN